MKLYYSKGACSLAVRIVINELGLNADYEAVDLKAKKTETGSDFLQINPKGAVPTLITNDNQILTENAVIQQYLADQSNKLLPPLDDFKRYQVLEWLNFITTELHKTFSILFNPQVPKEVKDNIFIPLIQKKFEYVEKNMKKPFLLGDQMTLPDAYLYVMLRWAKNFHIDLSAYPEILKFFDQLSQRESIRKSLKDEGLSLLSS